MQLDLDSVPIPPGSVQAVESATPSLWGVVIVLLMVVAIVAATIRGQRSARQPARFALNTAPLAAKFTWSFVLAIYAGVHVLAAITVYLDTRVVYASTAEYFQFIKPARLMALSHAHLMAIATMDAFAALLFSYSQPTSGFSTGVVTATFIGIVGDIGAWWLIKYWGGGYELVSIATGILFSGGFATMLVAILFGTWRSGLSSVTPSLSESA